MSRNIEIKARLSPGQAERIRELALARSALEPELLEQRDTFYLAASGRLKLRELGKGRAELIAYQRPDQAGPKPSSYLLFPCSEPALLHELLARSVGVRGVVEKRREVVHVGRTRVHLDEVLGLGRFLELEVVLGEDETPEQGEAIAVALMAAFGIAEDALVEGAYIDLLEAGRRGAAP